MHVSFDETNPLKEDIVSCDDDDDVLHMPIEYVIQEDHQNSLE